MWIKYGRKNTDIPLELLISSKAGKAKELRNLLSFKVNYAIQI